MSIPKALGMNTGQPSFPRCCPRPGTLTTHQHRMHFISPKGGTEGCQLSLLRYQRRPKRHARGPSACMVSASSGTLFSGAAGKDTERLPAHSGGTPWHRRWWHGAACGFCQESRRQEGVQVPGHCLQQSEGLTRTGLAQVSRGHCTFSQCTSPVVPCGECRDSCGTQGNCYKAHALLPGLSPCCSAQRLRAPMGAGAALLPD